MPKNRIIYNTLGVFVSQTTGVLEDQVNIEVGDVKQLTRLQSFDFDINKNYETLEELGSLSAISIENDNPTITANLSYYLANHYNEQYIGLNIIPPGLSPMVQCLSGIISQNFEKNYYLAISPEGIDLNNDYANINIIGLGNVCLTSYELNASVGAIPTVSIGLEALNVKYYSSVNKIWAKNQRIEPFKLSLFDAKIKFTNYNENSDLMIIGLPNDSIPSISDGPAELYIQDGETKVFEYSNALTGASSFTTSANLDRYGYSIAASNNGKYIVVGGPNSNDNTGAALLYTRNINDTWSFVKKISGVNNNAGGPIFAPPGGRYGTNVAISKNSEILCMMGPFDESNYGGVLIYTGN
jgi:hypothetical protein